MAFIKGKYHTGTQNISIDFGSHLFESDVPVAFHEITHYYLTKFTNHGACQSILSEILLRPDILKEPGLETHLKESLQLLHSHSYLSQEGFAHFMQLAKLFENGGLDAIKDLEDRIPPEAKHALSYLRFSFSYDQNFRDLLSEKLIGLSFGTALHRSVIANVEILKNPKSLETYLDNDFNSPNKRFERLCQCVEKDPELIKATPEGISQRVGIDYNPPISNAERATLINVITSLTTKPENLTESDIRSLNGSNELLLPAFESMIFRDANLETDAITNLSQEQILKVAPLFRTIFVYNNPESPKPPDHFGFYAMFGRREIVNGVLKLSPDAESIFNKKGLARVIDTHGYDYKLNAVRLQRTFVRPNIVWYKNFIDFRIFLEMVEDLRLNVEFTTIAFTEKHPYWFYIFGLQNLELLHILVAYPFVNEKIKKRILNLKTNADLVSRNPIALNNFVHDILGMPYLLNINEMLRDPEKHLNRAKVVKEKGLPRNEICICGSQKKWKRCHGY